MLHNNRQANTLKLKFEKSKKEMYHQQSKMINLPVACNIHVACGICFLAGVAFQSLDTRCNCGPRSVAGLPFNDSLCGVAVVVVSVSIKLSHS